MSGDGAARWVGQAVRRREDPRLLTGHGRYVDDVTMPGLLHAAFVRSPVARGTDPRHRHQRRAGPARAWSPCTPPRT